MKKLRCEIKWSEGICGVNINTIQEHLNQFFGAADFTIIALPEPEKETKGIDIGVVVKDENTLISPLLIDGKVVDKIGIYPSEVENIMVWVVDRNIRINPKPPEKKELPEKLINAYGRQQKQEIISAINILIDIISEMRKGR